MALDGPDVLLYEKKDKIVIITINRPERMNAISYELFERMEEAWARFRDDDDAWVAILTGAGDRGFCAGLDMKEAPQTLFELAPDEVYRFQAKIARLQLSMRQIPQPIICAIHKSAVGGGFSFAMASDVRIITPETRFSAAYINIGLGGADMGSSYFLPRLIGAGRAYEFLLTGDFMNADEALKLGLVSRIVSQNDLMPTAMELAKNMVSKNPLGLRLTKEAINQNIDAGGLEQALQMENRNQALCILANRLQGNSPISR